ncbi:MAG: hypothetical protein LC792_22600, partial [Actinobacteria bacterium]|nr:hypothetical protein [Actinomycetota bacterium]
MKPVIRLRWATVALLATFALAACNGGGESKSTANGKVDPDGTTVAQSYDDLSKALNLSVPDGYMLQPDSVGDTGPSDLDKAVADDGEADSRDVLTRTHFVRGYQRMWARSEDDQIISYVYQFADHGGAVDFTNRLTADAGAGSPGVNTSTFTVPAIDGAVGLNGSDASSATSSVTFVKGPYSVQMVVN